MMLRDRVLVLLGEYFKSAWLLLRRRAASYTGAVFENASWLDDNCEIRMLAEVGSCFVILGG
jgi:hypothetical protein